MVEGQKEILFWVEEVMDRPIDPSWFMPLCKLRPKSQGKDLDKYINAVTIQAASEN